MLQARLGKLVFEGGAADAVYDIAPDGLKGWFEGVGVRAERTPRPSSHGFFPGEVFRGGRTIILKGKVLTSDPVEQEHALARLTGLLGDGQKGRFEVETPEGTTWADVQLDDGPEITMLIYGEVAEYRLQLWAEDGIRYGKKRRFASGKPVWHRGNAPAFPVVTVKGPASAYTISAAGKSFSVTQALAAGQSHVVHLKSGAVYRNGVRQLGVVSNASRWSVPPGRRVVHTVSGSGEASIALTDHFN